MSYKLAALLLASFGIAEAQQIGTTIPEVHPKLPTQKCTTAGGCVTKDTKVVADALRHPFHVVGDMTKSCNPNPRGKDDRLMDKTLCPDAATCAKNCVFEGVDYKSIGVTTEGSALNMRLYMKNATGGYDRVSPRLYLLAEDDQNYEPVRLLNQEFTFDVDTSALMCGSNGALYLDEMDMSGFRSATNPAGAAYGTGYCDAQCYNKTMLNGEPNMNNRGACCMEMDIWEANGRSTALTPHSCSKPGSFACVGDECGKTAPGMCDKSGCALNPYKTVGPSFYGINGTVDTSRPFTVVTQFFTQNNATGEAGGVLSSIRRLYVQDGRTIPGPENVLGADTITKDFCDAKGPESFNRLGGLPEMGASLDRGMVLIFSIWDTPGDFMNWLDAGAAGPCGPTEGDPKNIIASNPDVSITFSNIRWGDIGSTIKL